MKTISTIQALRRGALFAVFVPLLWFPALTAPAAGTSADPGSSRALQTIPAALQPAFYQALVKDAGATYRIGENSCVVLTEHSLKACFDTHGAHFTGAMPLSLHLVAFGRGSDLASVTSVRPQINGNEASYRHGNLTEWWRVLPIGFEQGFTIAKRPAGHGELTLALSTSRRPGAGRDPVKKGIPTFGRDPSSHWIPASAGMTKAAIDGTLAWGKLRYGKLVVTDAKGRVVPATLISKGDRILIAVNDVHARYPLTVDPLVWVEQKVTASDGATHDQFGSSVAVDGSTALVGAEQADVNGNSNQGAVYVFSESGGTWSETQKLTASDGAADDQFGFSVALDGTTALVGAASVPGKGKPGAAYVFAESGGTWTQTAKLIANDGAPDDLFGFSVALDGSTALVGALLAFVNGNLNEGAAYVFTASGGNWGQAQKLTVSDGVFDELFGASVALDGATALVGARKADVNGSQNGAAYVFTKSAGVWGEAQKLVASDGAVGDYFGHQVALDGPTALVSALQADVNGHGDAGAAYVFNKSGGVWSQTQKLIASDGGNFNAFGASVALSGPTILVGSNQVSAVYVFAKSGGVWSQTQKLTSSDTFFGFRVGLDGTNALVGADLATVNGNAQQGAAYFYGGSDLDLAMSAPATVGPGENYVSQTIATNNSGATSAAVSATITVPAGTNYVSATATQGSCSQASGVVTCIFGVIAGGGGTAKANVTLKATGNEGDTIVNTASIVGATPPLEASALTEITAGAGCPNGYSETDGTLTPGQSATTPSYQAPAGQENAILTAPAGFQLSVQLKLSRSKPWKTYSIPGFEVHKRGPAGAYRWIVKAKPTSDGGNYTLCIKHP